MTLPWYKRGLPEPPKPPEKPPVKVTPFPTIKPGWAPGIVQGPIGEVNPYPLRVRLGVSVLSINPRMTWDPDGTGGYKSVAHMPWEVSEKQLGYIPSYWEDPHRLVAAHNLIRTAPVGSAPPDWLDAPRIREAYDYMKFANRGAPSGEWRFLNANDPGRQALQSISPPPDELLRPADLIKYTPPEQVSSQLGNLPKFGSPEFDALPWWAKLSQAVFGFGGSMPTVDQRLATSAKWRALRATKTDEEWAQFTRGRERIFGAAQGLAGGVPTAVISGALHSPMAMALMATAGAMQGYARAVTQEKIATQGGETRLGPTILGIKAPTYKGLDSALYHVGNWLDIGAQILEKIPGTVIQVGASLWDPQKYGPIGELIMHPGATWNAGGVAYETQPIVQELINWYGDTWADAARALGMSEEDIQANQRNLPFYGAVPGKSVWQLGQSEPTMLPPELQTADGWESFGQGMQEARQLMMSGSYTTEEATMIVAQEYGFTGQMADFLGHVVIDPLNLAAGEGATRGIRFLGERVGNTRLVEAADIAQKMNRVGTTNTLRVYGNYLRTMVPPDEVAAMGPISRILGGVTAAGESTVIPGLRVTMEGEPKLTASGEPVGVEADLWVGGRVRLVESTPAEMRAIGAAEDSAAVIDHSTNTIHIREGTSTKAAGRHIEHEIRHADQRAGLRNDEVAQAERTITWQETHEGVDPTLDANMKAIRESYPRDQWATELDAQGILENGDLARLERGEAVGEGRRTERDARAAGWAGHIEDARSQNKIRNAPKGTPVEVERRPARGAWYAATVERIFSLTPRARSFEGIGILSENMRGLLAANSTVEEVHGAWTELGSIDRREVLAVSYKFLNSSDGMIFVQAVKDFGPKEGPHFQAWVASTPQRTLLHELARFMGMATQDFVKLLKTQGAEGTYKAIIGKLEATQDPTIRAMVDSWRLQQPHIDQLVDLYVKNKVPWSEEEWKAGLYSMWINHSAEWLIDKLGVKVEPMVWRMADFLKGVYSLGLLDVNAAYAIANGLNNLATLIVDRSFKPGLIFEYQKFWKEFGVLPFRLAQSFGGAAGLGENVGGAAKWAQADAEAMGLISSAARGKGGINIADELVSKVRRKVGFASKVSSALERASSIMATTSGTKEWWSRTWNRGQGFRRMPANIEELLGPQLTDMVYGLAEHALNQEQLVEAFSRRAASRPLESYITDLAKDLGKTPADVRAMLDQAGALDYLNANLPKAKTTDDIRAIFAAFEQEKQADFAELGRKDGEARAGEAAAQLQTGDLFGFLDGWYSNNRRRGQWWTQHTLGMAEMMREVQDVGDAAVRRTIIATRMAAHRSEWQRVNQAENDMMAGMVEGMRRLGYEVPEAVVESQASQVRARNLFFDYRDKTWHEFFDTNWQGKWKERQARYLEILQDLDHKYGAMATEDVRFQQSLDEATVQLIRSKNPEAADTADVLLTELRDRMAQTYAEEQTVRRLAYQMHTVQRATGAALVAEIRQQLAVMPGLLARIGPLLQQMAATTGEFEIGSVWSNIYRAYLDGVKLPSIADYYNLRNVGVGMVFGIRAAPLSTAAVIQGRLPEGPVRTEEPGAVAPEPGKLQEPAAPGPVPTDLDALRKAASLAGIATSSDSGAPINAHLVNWLNTDDGLGLRTAGAPIKRVDELTPEMIAAAIPRLGERATHFADLAQKAKSTGVTVEAQRALERWDGNDGPGLVKARRLAVASRLDQGTADILGRDQLREWLTAKTEGRPYNGALPATLETLRAFVEKATGGGQKALDVTAVTEARARSEGMTTEEYLAKYYGQDDPGAVQAYYQAKGELHPWAQRALDAWGVTRDAHEAGFVLPDGRMLDLTGRGQSVGYEQDATGRWVPKPGEPDYLRGQRSRDHHEVANFMDDGDWDATDLDHFLAATGTMRVSLFGDRGQEMFMVQANSAPTDEQMRTIYSVMNRYPGATLSWDVVDPKSGRAVALGSGPIREEVVAFEEGARTNGRTYMQLADDPQFTSWFEPSTVRRPDGRPQIAYIPGGNIVPLADSGSAVTRYGPGVYAFADPKRATGDVRPIERVVRFNTREEALAAKPITPVHQDPISGKWVATIRDYELVGSGAASPVPLRKVGLQERGRYLASVVDTETFRTMQARLSDAERGLLRQTLQKFVNGGWLPDLVKLEDAPYRLSVTDGLIRSGLQAAGQQTPVYLRITKPADMAAPIPDVGKLADAVIATLKLTEKAAEAARAAIEGPLGQRSMEEAFKAVPGLEARHYAAILQQAGYDGIRFVDQGGNPAFVAFDPSQVRSAFRPDVSPAEGTTFFQDGVAPKAMKGMYLLGQQVTSARMKQAMAPADFRSWLRGKGVKEDELHWSGMDDWLESVAQTPGARVTPEMARAFYEANPFRVDVSEYPGTYTAENANSRAYGSKRAWIEIGERAQGGRVWEPDTQRGSDESIYENPTAVDARFNYHGPNTYTSQGVMSFRTLEEAKNYADLGTYLRREEANWGKYQTGEGGKNYTELVISMPQQQRPVSFERWMELQNSWEPDARDGPQNRAIYDALMRRRDPSVLALVGPRISARGSHQFPQDNIMAWVRLAEWRTADGERVALIEEIQSDIHNKGRRFGYKSSEDQAKIDAAFELSDTAHRRFESRAGELERMWGTIIEDRTARVAFIHRHGDHWRDIVLLNEQIDQNEAAGLPPRGVSENHDYELLGQWEIDAARALRKIAEETRDAFQQMKQTDLAYDQMARNMESKLPDVPWKDTYHELAMKHMTRWAATHGFDRLAWTTGMQQTKRWSAWQVADVLTWARNADSDTYDVLAYKDDGVVHQLGQATLDEIADTYGPGIAELIGKEAGKMDLPKVSRVPINLGGQYVVEYKGSRGEFPTYETAEAYARQLMGDGHPVMLNHGQGLGSQYDLGGRLFEQDLNLPSRGFASFYDEKLPGWARKTAGKFKGAVEDVDLLRARGSDEQGWQPQQAVVGMPRPDEGLAWHIDIPDAEGVYHRYGETFATQAEAMAKRNQLQEAIVEDTVIARVHSMAITDELAGSVLMEGQTYFQHPVGDIMQRNLAESERALTAEIRRTYPDYGDADVAELVDAIRAGQNTLDVVGVRGSLAWAESALAWRSQEYARWFDLAGLLQKLGREPTFEDLKKLAVGDRRYDMVERGIPGEGSYKLYQAEGALSGYAEVRTNFPEADFWIVRKGTKDTVGTVTKTFSPENIGVKITATGEVDPNYLYYAMQYVQSQGYFKQRAHGTTGLQNITVRDVQEVRFGGRRTLYQVDERPDGRFTVNYKGIPFMEVKDRATADRLAGHFEQEGVAAGGAPRGSATLTAENTWILRAFDGAGLDTAIHESIHPFMSQVAKRPEWAGPTLDWMRKETGFGELDFIDGRLTGQEEHVRAGHELFANAGVRYIREGKAPSLSLVPVFERLKAWLTEIYRTIKGSSIDVNLTDEIRQVFDGLLSTAEERQQFAEYHAKQQPAKVEERPAPSVLPEGVAEQGTARLQPTDTKAGELVQLRGEYLRGHLNRTVSNELMKLSGHRDATGRPMTRAEFLELMAARGQGYVNMGHGAFGWFPPDMRPLQAGNTLRLYFDFLREQSGVRLISGVDESIRDNLLEMDHLMGQPVPDMQTVNGREVWSRRAADIKDVSDRVEELLQSKGETMGSADLDAYRRIGMGVQEQAVVTPKKESLAPEAGVRGGMTDDGRLVTKSGREIPRPKYKTERRLDLWLLTAAREELQSQSMAERLGKIAPGSPEATAAFQLQIVASMDPKRLSPSDRTVLNEILFGMEEVRFDRRPAAPAAPITPANAPRPLPDTPDAIFRELNQLTEKLLGEGAPNRADDDRFVAITDSMEPKKSMTPLEWETAFQVWLLLEPENARNLTPAEKANRLDSLKAKFLASKPTGASLDLTSWQAAMADVQATIRAAQPQVDTFKGSVRKAHGPDPNEQFKLRYGVIPLDQAVSSTRADGSNNPEYPQQYQPRKRDRDTYQLQANDRAAGLVPDVLLKHTDRIDDGSPIVDSGNVVLSGSGRIQSLLIARDTYPERFAAYQTELRANLPAYGITTEAMDAAAPGGYLLVRYLEEPGVNRQHFADLANASTSAAMSPSEQAASDAKLISAESVRSLTVPETSSIEEALGRVDNADFTRSFIQGLPEPERASLATKNGQLNSGGASRIVAALFARVFQGEAGRRMLDRVFESQDNNVRRVSSGIKNALPSLARVEDLVASGERPADYGIAVDLAATADALARIRAEGQNPTSWLQQGQMFGSGLTPFQEALLLDLGEMQSSKALRTWLENYAGLVEKQPSTKQTGMFGAYEYPPRDELWTKAKTNDVLTLFQMPDKMDLAPDGTVPPVIPHGAMAAEAWENVRPTFEALRSRLAGDKGWLNPQEINLDRRLTGEDLGQFNAWVSGVKQDMAANKMAAIRWGETTRDMSLLNYNQRRGYSGPMTLGVPYFFWPTDTALRWAMRAIDRPALLANYYRFRHVQELQEEIPGFPTRLKGKMAFYLPFLPDWMQDTLWIDPLSQLFPPAMFDKRLEFLAQDQARARQNVEDVLKQQVESGKISQAQAAEAIAKQAGPIWQTAKIEAESEAGADKTSPLDLVNVLTGFAPPVEWARQYINGTPQNIGPLPVTRQVKTITHALGIGPPGGVNLESGIRRGLNLPTWDRFEDYREDRALMSMVAEGKITLDQSERGMLERSGDAFDEARRRVEDTRLYGGFLNPLYWAGFPADIMPAGEERQRALSLEWQKASDAWRAGDEDARDAFLAKYPEYEARLMSLNMDPKARMRSYLIDEIWTRYRTFGRTDKQMVVQQLGRAFEQLFLDKETRNYDGVDTQTLAMWAQALGMWTPKTKDTEYALPTGMSAPEVKLLPPELSSAVDAFKNARDEQFPFWYALQTRYYQQPPGAVRRAFLVKFPQLKAYWAWKDKQYAQHPEVKTFIQGLEVSAGDQQVGILSMPEVLSNDLLMRQLFGATYAGRPLSSGALSELMRLWEAAGQPMGTLQAWLNTADQGLTAP